MLLKAALFFGVFPILHAPVAYALGEWRAGLASGVCNLLSWFVLPTALWIVTLSLRMEDSLWMFSNAETAGLLMSAGAGGCLSVGVVSLAGLLGRFEEARRRATAKDAMSRAELVERLEAVRSELEIAELREDAPTDLPRPGRIVWVSLAVLAVGFLAPLALGPLVRAEQGFVEATDWRVTDALARLDVVSYGSTLAGLVLAVTDVAALLVLGYISGRFRIATVLAFAYFLGQNLAIVLPSGPPVPAFAHERIWAAGAFPLAVFTLIAYAGTVLRKVNQWDRRRRRLSEGQMDALRAEILDLEWRLAPKRRFECVMSVDVVGSTSLKDGAEPIATEATFRRYLNLVMDTSGRYGGRVLSTAGDGAVVGFARAEDALAAALAIHREIAGFNTHSNSMGRDFQLRIGLHLDEVYGELSEVQFSRAIDVACHIEGKARPGGIAVSTSFAAALPDQSFSPLDVEIDGYGVLETDSCAAALFPGRPSPVRGERCHAKKT